MGCFPDIHSFCSIPLFPEALFSSLFAILYGIICFYSSVFHANSFAFSPTTRFPLSITLFAAKQSLI
jgi:hypothetical protein